MSEMTRNGRRRRCPICGRGFLRPRRISEVFEYGPDGDTVLVRTQDVPIEDCDVCGESFSGPKAARIRHDAIGHALGLLPPQEVRAIRERLGLSLEGFAKLIGVKADRLEQWESGMLWQDRTADRLLRLLAINYDNARYLESITESDLAGPAQPGPGPSSAVPAASQIETQEYKEPPARPKRHIVRGADFGEIRRHPESSEPPSTSPPPR